MSTIHRGSILALIPARGGSKGVPQKNIKILHNKPLISWTIEQALKSQYIDRVVVSTDSEEIAEVARSFNAHVPFLRPLELATDTANSKDAIFHAIDWLKNHGESYDTLVFLQPTSPLRLATDIDNAIELFFEKKAEFVVGVCEAEHPPLWMNTLPGDGCMKDFLPKAAINRNRQELSKYYRVNGAVYVANINSFKVNQSFFNDHTFAYVMPQIRSIDIDNQMDFDIAELFLTKYFQNINEVMSEYRR